MVSAVAVFVRVPSDARSSVVGVLLDLPGRAPFKAIRVPISPAIAYWSVVDAEYRPFELAEEWLFHLRFGVEMAEGTTQNYAGCVAHYLNWAAGFGFDLVSAAEKLSRYVFFLDREVITHGRGKGSRRQGGRINGILHAVRGMYRFGVTEKALPQSLLGVLYEVGDGPLLPTALSGGSGLRMKARVRHSKRQMHAPPVDAASLEEWEALLLAATHWRDRFLLLLPWVLGMRIGGVLGMRRSDLHFGPARYGKTCISGPHVHIVRRDNINRASAKHGHGDRGLPVPGVVLEFYERYLKERGAVPAAAWSDFVFVNLWHEPIGEPMKLHAIDPLLERLSAKAGLPHKISSHQFRHAATTRITENASLEVAQAIVGHRHLSTTQRYNHPSDERLRHAVEIAPATGLPEDAR